MEFLRQEYFICLIFVVAMFIVITFLTEEGVMTAVAFAVGAVISIICGAVGMVIATQTNFRTTYCARLGLAPAFRVAYRAGCAMGFALVSLGLLGNDYFTQSLLFLFSFINLSMEVMTSIHGKILPILVSIKSFSRQLQAMVLEDHSLPFSEESEEVSTLRLLMSELIWSVRLRKIFPRIVPRTQLLLLITLEIMSVMLQV